MKSSFTFFKWGFFLLVALNITLITLYLLPREDRHHGPPDFGRIIEHLDEKLRLSAKQHDELVRLFEMHKSEIDSLHDRSRLQHERMMECLQSGATDCDLSDHSSFDQILYVHHQRILKILTAKQRQTYLEDLETDRPPGPPPF